MYFVTRNLPEQRLQVLLSEKELSKLPENSPHIFKKSNIDRYVDWASPTICYRKYISLNDLSCVEFLVYCTLESKPCGDLVDQTFFHFNENLINNQDPHSQIENDETPRRKYLNEND